MNTSIIIPTHNRKEQLTQALFALGKGSVVPNEVLVIDDASSINVSSWISDLKLPFLIKTITVNPGKGAANARNLGIQNARYELLVFIDDDIYVDPWFLEAHIRIHSKNPDASYGVMGRIYFDPNLNRTPFLHYMEERGPFRDISNSEDGALQNKGLISANFSIKRDFSYKNNALFDVNFPFNRSEDTEFGVRMVSEGWNLHFHKYPSARHHSPITFDQYLTQSYQNGLGKAYWSRKSPDQIQFVNSFYTAFRKWTQSSELDKHLNLFDQQFTKSFLNSNVFSRSKHEFEQFCNFCNLVIQHKLHIGLFDGWLKLINSKDDFLSYLNLYLSSPFKKESLINLQKIHDQNPDFLPFAIFHARERHQCDDTKGAIATLEPHAQYLCVKKQLLEYYFSVKDLKACLTHAKSIFDQGEWRTNSGQLHLNHALDYLYKLSDFKIIDEKWLKMQYSRFTSEVFSYAPDLFYKFNKLLKKNHLSTSNISFSNSITKASDFFHKTCIDLYNVPLILNSVKSKTSLSATLNSADESVALYGRIHWLWKEKGFGFVRELKSPQHHFFSFDVLYQGNEFQVGDLVFFNARLGKHGSQIYFLKQISNLETISFQSIETPMYGGTLLSSGIPSIIDRYHRLSRLGQSPKLLAQHAINRADLKLAQEIKSALRVAIFGINNSTSYSGGRYHALMLAVALSELGFQVDYYTNVIPLYYNDLKKQSSLYRTLQNIHFKICDLHKSNLGYSISEKYAALFIIPHFPVEIPYINNVIRFKSHFKPVATLLINFETPNWFNSMVSTPRHESLWDGWKQLSEVSDVIISSSKIAIPFAQEYFKSAQHYRHVFLPPPLTTRIADTILSVVKRKRRIILFTRGFMSEHKGSGTTLDLLDTSFAKYDIDIIVGGKIDASFENAIKQLTRQHGLKISLHCKLDETAKWQLLCESFVVIYLSEFEGFGLPPAEALYAGCHCIVRPLPVLKDFSGDRLIYFEGNDSKKLRDILDGLPPEFSLDDEYAYKCSLGRFATDLETLLASCGVMRSQDGVYIRIDEAFYNRATKSVKIKARFFSTEADIDHVRISLPNGTPVAWSYPERISLTENKNKVYGSEVNFVGRMIAPRSSEEAFPKLLRIAAHKSNGDRIAYTFTRIAGSSFEITDRVNDKTLASYKNKHKGSTFVILGNGPSVSHTDFKAFNGMVSIAANRFFLIYPRTEFRPTYTLIEDPLMVAQHMSAITAQCATPLFVPEEYAHGLKISNIVRFRFKNPNGSSQFSNDLTNALFYGASVVFTAMQLAVSMGASRILLYGVDHNFSVPSTEAGHPGIVRHNGESNHFDPRYRSQGELWAKPESKMIEASFGIARKFCEDHGIEIFNITRGGNLEVFRRMDLSNLSKIKHLE